MKASLVTIGGELYNKLLEARTKLEMIRKIAEADNESYGYSSATSKAIDLILGIEREKE